MNKTLRRTFNWCSCLFALTVSLLFFQATAIFAQTSYFTDLPVYSTYETHRTSSVALGDVDGDGDLDLVCGCESGLETEATTLYLNAGGTFSPVPTMSLDPSLVTHSVALGDVDGDGDLDLVCGNLYVNTLHENSGGLFTPSPVWSADTSLGAHFIALGDVDGDGDLDLISDTSLYRNTGTTFTTTPVWSSDSSYTIRSVALGDVDGDEDLDLVCGAYDDHIMLFENIGGTFSGMPVWSSDSIYYMITSITLGDVDGDGDLDLACGNWTGDDRIVLFENTGTTFSTDAVWRSAPANMTSSIALGDIDGDGDLDLVCGREQSWWGDGYPHVKLYENTGGTLSTDPVWNASQSFRTTSIALGDIDTDGDLDLVCGNDGENNTLYDNTGAVLSEVSGWSPLDRFTTRKVTLEDVDNDGDLDLACANDIFQTDVYENTGDTLSTIPLWTSPLHGATCLALGDIDGDGYSDLVMNGLGIGPGEWACIMHYRNTGGTFTNEEVWYADTSSASGSPASLALGDVDNDGDLDLVCGNYYTSNTLYYNTDTTFTNAPVWQSTPVNCIAQSVALGDVDGDGDLDLACGNSGPEARNALYDNIGGTFTTTPVWSPMQAVNTYCVAFGDIDGDGDLDLVCANSNTANTLYENINGLLSAAPVWVSTPGNDTRSIALTDIDGDGDLDLLCGNYQQGNTLYENRRGTLSPEPVWTAPVSYMTYSIAAGDVDRDGDIDLVAGMEQGYIDINTTLYSGMKNPAFKGDLLAPTGHTTNNGAFIRNVSTRMMGNNSYWVGFSLCDLESDWVKVAAEYQLSGENRWHPAAIVGGGWITDPLSASPEGTIDSLIWDVTGVPFSDREVMLRLSAIEIPRRVSIIKHAASFLHPAGRIVPVRPELTSSVDSLLFSGTAVTVGDTAAHEVILSNTGTIDLHITEIVLPSLEMRIDRTPPVVLAPGEAETMTVYLEPRYETEIAGQIEIMSDDPLTPVRSIPVVTDIRPLEVSNEILKSGDAIPLGEAVTVVVTPAADVRVEHGYIHFRPAGSSAFADSIVLSPFKGEFVVIIPGEQVTEAGLDYFIRVENSNVYGTDPAGAPQEFYYQEVTSPVGLTSEAVPNSGSEYLAGREIKIYAILPEGAVFERGALHYRTGGSLSYITDSLSLEDVFPEAAIPDSMVGARGIEYWVDAVTLTTHLSDPSAEPHFTPHTLAVTVPNLVEPNIHAGGEETDYYRITSIPLRFKEDFTGTLEALLSEQAEFGSYDPLVWRAWAYLQESNSYGELNDPSLADYFRPKAGRAWWLISKNSHQISTAPIPGISTATGSPFTIDLAPGRWSMVGCPFAFTVSFDSVLVDTLLMAEALGVLIDPPVRWSGAYSTDVPLMEPFEGYWIFNRSDQTVTLSIPPVEANGQPAPAPLPADAAGEGWHVTLAADAAGTGTARATVGVIPSAHVHLDRFDRMQPPPVPGRSLALSVLDAGAGESYYRYSVNVRPLPPAGGDWGYMWTLDLAKNFSIESAGDRVAIAVDSVSNLPADASIALIDRTLDRQIALDDNTEHLFYLGTSGYGTVPEDARFLLIVGTDFFVQEEAARLLQPPARTSLSQNYPNPFNPATIIRYEIAEPGLVGLRIYDVTGALVAVLEERHRDRGRYETGWNGLDKNGSPLASGVYFYRLTAPGFSRTRKMVLLR